MALTKLTKLILFLFWIDLILDVIFATHPAIPHHMAHDINLLYPIAQSKIANSIYSVTDYIGLPCLIISSLLIFFNRFSVGKWMFLFTFILFELSVFIEAPYIVYGSHLFLKEISDILQGMLLILLFALNLGIVTNNKNVRLKQSTSMIMANQSNPIDNTHVHPWIRFTARLMDIGLFVLFLTGILLLIEPFIVYFNLAPFNVPQGLLTRIISSMVIFFLWVFVESILLSTWGTTVGKWFFNISIHNNEGEELDKLSFSLALKRSFLVWFKGIGGHLPVIFIITYLTAYFKLSKKGLTSWDSDCQLRIQHGDIGIIKKIILVLILANEIATPIYFRIVNKPIKPHTIIELPAKPTTFQNDPIKPDPVDKLPAVPTALQI